MTNDELVEQILHIDGSIAYLVEIRDRLAMELRQNMEADGAMVFVSDKGTAAIKETVTYDHSLFGALLEYIPEQELIDDGALIPEHEETIRVPRKWNTTKVKKFAKRGKAVKDAIESARMVKSTKLEVRE